MMWDLLLPCGLALAVLLAVLFAFADTDFLLALYEKFGKDCGSLSGKVVWITGASSGIGEHIAYCLAKSGCRLVLTARRVEELERVKQACISQGPNSAALEKNILVLPLDVVHFHKHREAVQTVLEHFGQIDILVNNAARGQFAEWIKVELDVDRELFETNVLGPVSLSQEVVPHMIKRGGGQIVVTSSMAGKMGLPGARSYTGSKHAIHGYFESLRTEMAGKNIEVTLICPGPTFSQLYLTAATERLGETLGLRMEKTQKRMSTSRCAYLSCVAMANQVSEAWIMQQPVLLTAYIIQYAPVLGRWLLKKFGPKQVQKIREGK
ncbi:dehydrogenase/reductase SDR family member 7 [Aplysia californica]|uniref:Dehydrogenase/reductase SDR family member 7 n=1 Tax=Aplysia californica TaxID=6500 RepID=A0ABM1VS95_APLCA|nr:dehydrogenase/reductase SDR family member 7 [Aplysia californica]XP_035825287.1 dehydrogenase/reductase SDR family member 7 [Aplysia californica]